MASIGWKPETAKGETLRCTNCGAALPYPRPGSSKTICPYCQSEVVVGTAYDALSAFTGALTQQARVAGGNETAVETHNGNFSEGLKGEINELQEAFQGGSAETIREKMDDLREKIGEMTKSSLLSGMSVSYVFKSCPHCGSSVQVTDQDAEVTECPHCGYAKRNGEKDG